MNFSRNYLRMVGFIRKVAPTCADWLLKHPRPVKFVLAGCAAGAINIILLYGFTEFLHIYYLASSVAALLVAWIASFFFQKFWRFREHSTERLHKQAFLYVLMQGGGLAVNTLLMYVAVEKLHIWYIMAQICISVSIALATYFINKQYIFQHVSY